MLPTGIVLTLGDGLDDDYVRRWAKTKGVNTLWDELLERIKAEETDN